MQHSIPGLVTIRSRELSHLGLLLGLWCTSALVTATQVLMFRLASGRGHYPPFRLFALHLLDWLPWAALTLVMFRLIRRPPSDRGGWARLLLLHCPLSLGFILAKFSADNAVAFMYTGISPSYGIVRNNLVVFMATSFHFQLLVYWLILAAAVLRAGRRSRAPLPEPALESRRLTIRSGGRLRIIPFDEIDRVEAADYYTEIHAGGEVHLMREPLSRLQRRLDARRFLRIHRSSIVNLARVRRVERLPGGDRQVVLQDGTRLRVSRSRRKDLEAALAGSG